MFRRDVWGLNSVNGKEINRLTEVAKRGKEDAMALVEIVVASVKEVSKNGKELWRDCWRGIIEK